MFGRVPSMRDKRRSMGGQTSSERASLREALRNRGGAKALATAAQSEAEDSEDTKSGLAWLGLNTFSSTIVKHAIDKLRSDVEKQIDRVRAPGADTDAEASAGDGPSGAAAGEGAPPTLAGLALPDFRTGGSSSSSSGSAAAPAAKPKAKGGLRAALQARGGVRRQDPKVLADLERVAEHPEGIGGPPPSPGEGEGRRTLSVVEEGVASPPAPPGGDEAAPGPAIPRPPAPSPGSEASQQDSSPRPPDGVPLPAEAEAQPDVPAAGAAAAAEAADVAAADGEAAAGAADGEDASAATAGEAAPAEVAAEATAKAADGGAAEAAGEAAEAASGMAAAEDAEAPPPSRRAASSCAVDGLAAEAAEVQAPPRKLEVASLGAVAWWLHQGKKGEPKDQAIEAKADPRRQHRGGTVGSKEPGKLNTLQEFWGGKKSMGFAAGPQLDKSNRLSKVEAQAALQRLVSAGSDLNEVRRLRKLIDQLD